MSDQRKRKTNRYRTINANCVLHILLLHNQTWVLSPVLKLKTNNNRETIR